MLKKVTLALFMGLSLALSAMTASADDIIGTGTFVGASDHETSGGVKVIKTANGGALVILDTDFMHDGAPDPRVGLGKDGKYAKSTDLGFLTNLAGVQVYVVPPLIDATQFNEVYIWCRKYSVSLGVAKLN
jgi:hypothetical protein